MPKEKLVVRFALPAILLIVASQWASSAERPRSRGVAPISAWECPATHPIKGNFTTYSGESCIYHVRGGAFYNKTKPERCYATADDARADGCRASKR
jgi:hypothetical protein